ncbi:MAG: 30S ribosomal protein S9 [Candidatus Paceibacterota bacterium]|jgi:small subunit ribosomal protein S9
MTPKPTTTKYFEAVGRRKTAIARIRLFSEAKTTFIVNEKAMEQYFPVREMQVTAMEAMKNSGVEAKFFISAKVKGGGLSAQSEAVRHGVARALLIYDKELRGKVKKLGYLKRDPRAKERRKFGLKKARKSPQWSKR